jgi:hypothetical protein
MVFNGAVTAWVLQVFLAIGLAADSGAWLSAQAPLWEQRFGTIVDVSTPAAAPCIAVLTGGEVAVSGYDGATIWRRDFRKFSRIFQAETVVVAPSCDWVVVTGNASYRYAWLLRRDGRDEYIGFRGVTPLAAAIHPDGQKIAITTSGPSLQVADANPFVLRKTIPYRGFGGVEYTTADVLLASRYGAGVIGADDTVKWSDSNGVCDISVPEGAAWSVTACSPPHFSSIGSVTVRDTDGALRWSQVVDSPQMAAAPDGSFIAVLGAAVTVQNAREIGGERRLRFVQPNGKAITEIAPPDGNIVGVTGAGLVIVQQYQPPTMLAFSKDGTQRVVLELPSWPRGARLAGRDRTTLLIWDEHRLQAFDVRIPLR